MVRSTVQASSPPARRPSPLFEALAGLYSGGIAFLAWSKLIVLDELLQQPYAPLLVLALVAELVVAAWSAWRPRSTGPWAAASLLGAGLLLGASLGPPIKSCFCVGTLARLGPVGRTTLAAVMLGAGLLGLAWTLHMRSRPGASAGGLP